MHIYVGRLRLESKEGRWWLIWHGAFAFLQARRANGVIHASVYREDGRTLWSLSVWKSRESMLAYRNSGSHLRVMNMAKSRQLRVDFRHWEADAVPSWKEARARLETEIGS